MWASLVETGNLAREGANPPASAVGRMSTGTHSRGEIEHIGGVMGPFRSFWSVGRPLVYTEGSTGACAVSCAIRQTLCCMKAGQLETQARAAGPPGVSPARVPLPLTFLLSLVSMVLPIFMPPQRGTRRGQTSASAAGALATESTRSSTSTIIGSNWVPAQRRSSARAHASSCAC